MNARPTVDELLWSWPSVCKAAKEEWAKGFTLSIAKHSKRRNWTPTPKQYALMRRLVADLYDPHHGSDTDDDGPLIEPAE